jgi:flavin-dependent dehydrogenase
MAQDPSLWETPCVGPRWALLGDAAGHVHPITGEGISYALWSAKLFAETLKEGKPHAYEERWRAEYGDGFIKVSEILHRSKSLAHNSYEILMQSMLVGEVAVLRH